MSKIIKYAKSRTVWVALIAGLCNIAAYYQIDRLAGLPVEEILNNKEVLASQLTVIAAGVLDAAAIIFRIKAKAKFD